MNSEKSPVEADKAATYAEEFIEALYRGFKNEALKLMTHEEFRADHENGLPLRTAIDLGYVDVASQLLSDGSNPNLGAREGKGSIVLALDNEYFDLVDLMLGKGAEISARDKNGWTPLIWASIKGRKRSVEFLLERRADLHVCSNDGWNAITGAFFKQHTGIVDLLKAHGARFGPKYEEAALLSAYQHGSTDIVRSLIAEGVNVNVGTSEGEPLLILVCLRGDIDILELLLEAGADVNIRDTNGNPALVSAIVNAQYAAASRLLAHGASVNVKGPKWAALHASALRGQAQLCESLFDAGGALNQLGHDRSTALMLACQNNHPETVDYLLQQGADPYLKNAKGESAYYHSINHRYSGNEETASTAVLKRHKVGQ